MGRPKQAELSFVCWVDDRPVVDVPFVTIVIGDIPDEIRENADPANIYMFGMPKPLCDTPTGDAEEGIGSLLAEPFRIEEVGSELDQEQPVVMLDGVAILDDAFGTLAGMPRKQGLSVRMPRNRKKRKTKIPEPIIPVPPEEELAEAIEKMFPGGHGISVFEPGIAKKWLQSSAQFAYNRLNQQIDIDELLPMTYVPPPKEHSKRQRGRGKLTESAEIL